MGSNPTQALGIVFFLAAFTVLAGAFAGGGILFAIVALVLLGIAVFFFAKCKPWEHQPEQNGSSSLKTMSAGEVKG
jgi:hypothetical protein